MISFIYFDIHWIYHFYGNKYKIRIEDHNSYSQKKKKYLCQSLEPLFFIIILSSGINITFIFYLILILKKNNDK